MMELLGLIASILTILGVLSCLANWHIRVHGPYSGWRKSAQCQRCGYILHGFDTPIWGNDQTCVKCGPNSTWKRVVARPVGLSGWEIAGQQPSASTASSENGEGV